MNWKRRTQGILLIAVLVALAGCVSNDVSDLEAYAQEVLVRKAPPIPPPPEMKTFERYLYKAADADGRDPFVPFFEFEPQLDDGQQVDNAQQRKYVAEVRSPRNREELERYELDSLRMVGTLENQTDLWAIVADSGGTVHRVKVGNYVGRNYGKILSISEERIALREIIQDGQGQYSEREAKLALADAER